MYVLRELCWNPEQLSCVWQVCGVYIYLVNCSSFFSVLLERHYLKEAFRVTRLG